MEKERVKAIANEINRQIMWSIDNYIYWSWGCDLKYYCQYQGMVTLVLRVSGCLHKGFVYISLNEGSDSYDIRITKAKRGGKPNEENLELVRQDVYADELGQVLDGIIERKPDWNDEEYQDAAQADSTAKGFPLFGIKKFDK